MSPVAPCPGLKQWSKGIPLYPYTEPFCFLLKVTLAVVSSFLFFYAHVIAYANKASAIIIDSVSILSYIGGFKGFRDL